MRDGVFLVRDSNTSPRDYVLSVLHNVSIEMIYIIFLFSNLLPLNFVFDQLMQQNEVFHYQIRRHGEDAFFSIDDQTPIHGLDALIEHYQRSSDGLVTQLSSIIVNEPPPAESRRHGNTNLLHRATKSGNLLIVKEKLDSTMSNSDMKKYPLDAKDQDGRSAVHLACLLDNHNNAEAILEQFLKNGANVNCRDEEGNTPLHVITRNPLFYIHFVFCICKSIRV